MIQDYKITETITKSGELQKKENYDVAIIGAGISGLTAAALLSKSGLKVCVLEQDANIGGYLAGFSRQGFTFETAIHWLNNCSENGFVSRMFGYIDSNYPRVKPLNKIRRFVNKDYNYSLTCNPSEYENQLIADFPEDEDGIKRFFAAALQLSKSFENYQNMYRSGDTMSLPKKMIRGMKNLKFIMPFIPFVFYSGEKGVVKGLRKYFKSQKLIEMFTLEEDMLSILIPIAWAYTGDYQCIPEGGSQTFTKWLANVVEKNAGIIKTRSEVTGFVVENNVCKGIKYTSNKEDKYVDCKYVIAACDAELLYSKFLPKSAKQLQYVDKLNQADLYSSCFTVYVALDCPAEELGFGEEMIYLVHDKVVRVDKANGDPMKAGISILANSVTDKTITPQGKGSLSIYVPTEINVLNNWGTEKDSNGKIIRGELYKQTKKDIAEQLIQKLVDNVVPELRKHILFYETASPYTYQRYTFNKNGSIMGARPGKKNMQLKLAHYQTPVKNVYLGGHWSELGGGIPLTIKAASNVSLLILKQENKAEFERLANCMDGVKSV